jgi:hypothetical protein
MASLFSCVCIEDDMPEDRSVVDRSYAPSSRSFAPEQLEVSEKPKRHIDKIVIYTGAAGARDFVDEEEEADDSFSETYSNFEYADSVVDGGNQGG